MIKEDILIKNTTREQREQIVNDALGIVDGLCDGCSQGIISMYDASKNEKIESHIDTQIEEIITTIKERRIGDYLKGTVPVLINKACSFQYKQVRKTDNLTIKDTCIHCGLCAKECPEQAIEIKDHVTFRKEQCMMCLRCLHHCPVNAIQFKHKDKGQYRGLL